MIPWLGGQLLLTSTHAQHPFFGTICPRPIPALLAGPPLGRHGESDADGGAGLAHVRHHQQRLGSGSGWPVPVCPGPADDVASRAFGGSSAPRPHLCCLHAVAGHGRPVADAGNSGRFCHARTDSCDLGTAGCGARLPDASAAGADPFAGAAEPVAGCDCPEFKWHAGRHHLWPSARWSALCEGRQHGLFQHTGLVPDRRWTDADGALPSSRGQPGRQLGYPAGRRGLRLAAQVVVGSDLA